MSQKLGRGHFTPEQKMEAVNKVLEKKYSCYALAKEYDVAESTIKLWVRNFQSCGRDAFLTKKNKVYSPELKKKVIEDYLTGNFSQKSLCKKYGILSPSVVKNWIVHYNSHDEIYSSRKGGETLMTKGRKTTFKERQDIVKYCLDNQRNYAMAAEKFNVSYQQARSYVIKYENGGLDALEDRRGRRTGKVDSYKGDKEKRLEAELELVKAQLRWAEMERDFLKKLQEMERS